METEKGESIVKKKALGFYTACVTAALAVVTLVIALIYAGRGGQVGTLVIVALVAAVLCEASLFFGEKLWTDFTGIIAAVLLAYVLMTILSGGIWNIAEAVNGIKMVGLPELAGMNYALIAVNLAGIVTAVITCFARKSK